MTLGTKKTVKIAKTTKYKAAVRGRKSRVMLTTPLTMTMKATTMKATTAKMMNLRSWKNLKVLRAATNSSKISISMVNTEKMFCLTIIMIMMEMTMGQTEVIQDLKKVGQE